MYWQELLDILHRYLLSCLLMVHHELLEHLYQNLFDLSSQHLTSTVFLSDLLKLLVVLQEKSQVLIRNVNSKVSTLLLLLFFCSLTSAESVLLDFAFNLFGGIRHEDSWLRTRSGHLTPISLKRGEELIIETSWLRGFDLSTDVSRHSEIRVLIDPTRNQTGNVVLSKDMRETAWKTRSCLNCRISSLSAVIWEFQAEDGLEGCEVDVSLKDANIRIHVSHVLRVKNHKGFFRIESQRKDVFDILVGQICEFF